MFFDTNVLVRLRAAPHHGSARRRMVSEGNETSRISRQILREYLAVVTRPQSWSAAVSMNDALDHVAQLEAEFEILEDRPSVTNALATLCRDVPVAGKQVHDADIVTTMLAHGERRLLTFNASDFRRYGERIELVDMEGAE